MSRPFCCLAALLALAPATATADEVVAEDDDLDRERPALGIAPGTLQPGDTIRPDGAAAEVVTDGFELQFHGFLRIPARVGFEGGDLHAPPRVPDGAYTDWRFTNVQTGPWTELRFSYGNGRVAANVHIAAFDVTDASYASSQAQLGINESFLTLNYSDLFGPRGGVVWNVGAFSNRYGAAGRYSAGKYETYLFGATHVAGETATLFYDLSDDYTLLFEHGVGAKLQPTPFVPGLPPADFLPYPGDQPQGSTLVHHAHLGVAWNRMATVAAHYLTSWTDDADEPSEQDGHVTSVGVEVELVDSQFGDGYIGYGHLESETPQRLAGALEVLHTIAGWSICDVYFGAESECTGSVDTLLFQHTFSVSRFLWHPAPFWGQGPDVLVSAFGMFNRIDSDDPTFDAPRKRLKLGGEATYVPNRWLGMSLRYDLVQPDLDDANQSFQVITPRLIVTSQFASHEQVSLEYSHYIHGDGVINSYPFEDVPPDDGVFQITATMWW